MFAKEKNPTDREVAQLKIPPHSVEAEQSILGGLLLDDKAWERIGDQVAEADFYRADHRLIFSAIAQLANENQAIDAVTVFELLQRRGEAEQAGGLPYLAELARNTPTAQNIVAYAKIVRERGLLREMIAAANDIADSAYAPSGRTAQELLNSAEKSVFEIRDARAKQNSGPQRVDFKMLSGVLEKLDKIARGEADVGIKTGFDELDKMTFGLHKSDLVIVAARPSMGKCIVSGSRLLDPETGALRRIDDCVANASANVMSLNNQFQLRASPVSHFVDDGIKPVYRVSLRSGRRISTTLSHPFLTGNGWQPLHQIGVGVRVAVPRQLPVFGQTEWPHHHVRLLAYFIADGGLTQSSPTFTNTNTQLLQEFSADAAAFGGVITREIKSGERAPSIRVVRDEVASEERRQQFAQRLQQAAARHGLTQRDIAAQLGVVPSAVHAWWHATSLPSAELIDALADVLRTPLHELIDARDQELVGTTRHNPIIAWLDGLALWGKGAAEKCLPEVVFTFNRECLRIFLSRLFACDGSVYIQNTEAGTPQYGLSYATSSETLARDVQHLLLRFGVLAKLRTKGKHYAEHQAQPFELRITHQQSVKTFLAEIGLFGKEQASNQVQALLATKQAHDNNDSLPESVCDYVLKKKGERGWSHYFAEAGLAMPEGFNAHLSGQSRRLLTRDRAALFARLLNDDYLRDLASSDVFWDEVTAIDYEGEKQVYDLTVPDLHNFVAEDVLVHNTTYAMNLCENIALSQDKPVLVFSMEMPAEQLIMRSLASLGQVQFQNLRSGMLEPHEWDGLQSTVKLLKEKNNVYIDDTAGLSPMEMRARARRVHRQHGGLGVIMVDYLQLMKGDGQSENRTNEISEISRSLKALAKELNVPVIALSQLNRGLEQRTDKRPLMADLRESGAIEQDADVIMFIYRDEVYHKDKPDNKGKAEIIIAKQRNGPTGIVHLKYEGRFMRFRDHDGDMPMGGSDY